MLDVLTVGAATRDVFLKSSALKVLRDPKHLEALGFVNGEAQCFGLGAKIDVDEPVLAVGGGAANASVTFARQGLRTGAVVRVGEDEQGEAVLHALKNEGVTIFAGRDKEKGTAYATILRAPNGERTILAYRGAADGMSAHDLASPKIAARWVYVATGHLPLPILTSFLSRVASAGASIAINFSSSHLSLGAVKLAPLLKTARVVLVNREEAAVLTGVDYRYERKIFKAFDRLIEGYAVVTDGPRGAFVSDGTYLYHAGVFKEKALVDRTGAGDAFGSGFVAGLIQKNDVHYALRLASANATAVVEHVGAHAGVLTENSFKNDRFKYLDLDVEPL